MTVAATSRQNWYEDVLPNLGARQRAVMTAFARLGRASLRDIAAHLRVPVHTVSGRITELQNYGVLEKCGRDVNLKANIYRLADAAPHMPKKKPAPRKKRNKQNSKAASQAPPPKASLQIDLFQNL